MNSFVSAPAPLLGLLAMKGGVGSSSSATAFGGLYAGCGLRVAILCLDPHAFASQCFGHGPVEDPFTASPVDVPIPKLRRRGAPQPPPIRLYRGGPFGSASDTAIQSHLARARVGVDLVIADVGGDRTNAIGDAVVDMMTFAVVPLDADMMAYRGAAEAMIKIAERRPTPNGVPPARILKTRWDDQTNLAADVELLLGEEYPGLVLTATVPRDQAVREAVVRSQPVTIYRPASQASRAYKTAARELAAYLRLTIPRGTL